MANVLPKLPSRRLSARRTVAGSTEPALGLRLPAAGGVYSPGETLEFQYFIERLSAQWIDRLEVSVVWLVEGKGSEEMGVHFFQSHQRSELAKSALSEPRVVTTVLPPAPMSFDGRLFKIRWCVRLRLYLGDGREITTEQPFHLMPLACAAALPV
jgi:hypothetical protein